MSKEQLFEELHKVELQQIESNKQLLKVLKNEQA